MWKPEALGEKSELRKLFIILALPWETCEQQNSGIEVLRSTNPEATAAGAAYLAGLAVDFFHGREELKNKLGAGDVYRPAIDEATRAARMKGWHRAIKACRTFSESEE